jgi:hypothetical protein
VNPTSWSAAIASAAEAEREFWQQLYLKAGATLEQATWMAIERALLLRGHLLESARKQGVFVPGSDAAATWRLKESNLDEDTP